MVDGSIIEEVEVEVEALFVYTHGRAHRQVHASAGRSKACQSQMINGGVICHFRFLSSSLFRKARWRHHPHCPLSSDTAISIQLQSVKPKKQKARNKKQQATSKSIS